MKMRWTLLAVMLLASPAFAKKDSRALIDEYQAIAEDFARHDAQEAVALELGSLREWLGEARAYFKQDEESALRRTLDLVRVQARLIDALLRRAVASTAARQAHEQADAKESERERLGNEARTLQEELAALEKQAASSTAPAGAKP